MPKIENTSANVQEMLKKDGIVDQITKKLANILNGNLIVKKAEQDVNGSNIVDTYATKDEVDFDISDALNERGIQIVNLDSNGSTDIGQYEALNDIVVSGIYKINITGSDNVIGWLIVAPHNNALFQILIDYMAVIRYRTKDAPTLNWNNWEYFATYQQLQDKESDIMYQVTNNLTAIVETITLTTITNNTITTSNELGDLRDSKIYRLDVSGTMGWLIVGNVNEYAKNICQTLIDLDGSIYNRYHSEAGVGEEGWSDWIKYATQEDLNRKTEAFETIELTTTNISSLTVSNELINLIDEKIYKINCGYFSGWLFITQRGLQKKNAIQTIIDFDGNIYHRYRYITDITSEDRWSDWVLIPDYDYLSELLVSVLDERGIRQPDPIPSYDELTTHGVYSLYNSMNDNEYVFVVQSPTSSAEVSQYRLNSADGLLKRTYLQNMETGAYSWTAWSKYLSAENIDTSLSETSTNPVQNKVISNAFKSQGIQSYGIELSDNWDTNFKNRQELNNIETPGIYKLYFDSSAETAWLIVSENNGSSLNTSQILIDKDGTIYVRHRGENYGSDPYAWSEWIEYVTQDVANNTYLSKTDASTTYATKEELRPTPITDISSTIVANKSYNYGEQTELSIAFPAVANDGDVVYVTFTSGATATVLTLDTTNTSDIELIPEANTGYEIYAKYNGTIWIVNYSDYTITAEAGA